MGKLGSKQDLSRLALQAAEGVFSHAVDIALWLTIYMADMSLPQSSSGQLWRAGRAADRFLNQVNYNVIKNAILTAKKRGWVKTTRRGALPQITEEGKRRLAVVIPRYDNNRLWDGRMHLVTYDIPEKDKYQRESLRKQLMGIGCGKLQDSVWMTPYNPIDTLRTFIAERDLGGTIIISDLGHDASIGEENFHDLVVRIYKLEDINKRYEAWIKDVETLQTIDQLALFGYLSILRDDPQLPFDLLPKWWKGDEAYQRVERSMKKLSFSML
ncbi:hypothetical protein A3A63_03275 [Candidatus Gottesmanbacteria bacterium RIFCSPLOWO2_01_FULL_46_9]|uniref:Transcriptional repressor PaaX-like central Cas2-like domain-containing protein n=1 Tax=Candidatus Gottesmanbacteria bacterium RIFCSPLOWO2_01_FULL_46_9 TaxID=1798394 RepID=A0A1F6B4B0_9BACT|nr:MAG: hypothetical protein A3A63_03275 [Candidatus Gottesmanbacteria bacterium RIFCSPLOWO2_01_FULL_46_9]